MSRLPFPAALVQSFERFGRGNLSLLFDHGMDRYDESWRIGERKQEYFLAFAEGFAVSLDFARFLERREAALGALGAVAIDLTVETRLVTGLGLPHPTETGFLLDRTTGSPYLPGSSLKGLLRAAATESPDWDRESIERVFGPEIREGTTLRRGGGRFFDAFPSQWPKLEVDVLTPHHPDWNGGVEGAVPADWEDPIPVPFLAVAPETPYRFYLAVAPPAGAADLERLQALLPKALAEEGIGAKKSAGHGTFRRVTWRGVRLGLRQGAGYISHQRAEAACPLEALTAEARAELQRRKSLTVDVEVEKTGPWQFRVVRVVRWM